MKQSTKPGLRLRSVDGLLEEVALSIPEAWMEVLRGQSVKLGITVEEMIIQFIGHLAAEHEALGEAVASPTLSDDPARFLLRGSLLKSFEREAHRLGVPVVTVMHHAVADAADAFEGRPKAPMSKPLSLVAKRRKWLGR